MNRNQHRLCEENIINFVRGTNHNTKHVDLFPRDLVDVMTTGYGRVSLNHKPYLFDIVEEVTDTRHILRIFQGDYKEGMTNILPLVNEFGIDLHKAYSIWTPVNQLSSYVSIGQLEVPDRLSTATAWGLGLVRKNMLYPDEVINAFRENRREYNKLHAEDCTLESNAYRAMFKKFAPWLAGTWVADEFGNSLNARIIWGMTDYNPTYDEAVAILQDARQNCRTVSAEGRIDFVLDTLRRRRLEEEENAGGS